MKNDKGYVPINRFEIQESKLYPHGSKFTKFEAFFDLLMLAAHSETSFTAGSRCVAVKLKRGQLGLSFVSLANRWKWDRKTVRKFIQETLKKEENVDSKPYPEKNPETTVITINSYDYYVRNFEKTDTKKDTKKDTKRDTFNNYENYKKNDTIDGIPENPGCNDDSTSINFNRELSEKETDLIDAIISWAYDPDNNFLIEMPSEKTREQIENTIRKYGYDDIECIFDRCSNDRSAWDTGEEHKSAYSEFWDSIKGMKFKKEFDKTNERLPGIINAVNDILKTNFDANGSKNLIKIISNNADGNDIVKFLQWFKENGFKDDMTLDNIFSNKNWGKFLTDYKKWGKNLNENPLQHL